VKVFWSWQSDHAGKVSHYLVRDALQLAIAKLRVPEDIEEPTETDRRDKLELDHDTKGETGWTDIADSIFKKIEKSGVFVADVTPVAKSKKRKVMNPNVAIELGYAIKALSWANCLGVLNLAYGSVEDLPFDISRTRSWPVTYKLKEGATNEEIAEAKKKLANDLYLRLRPFLSKPVETVKDEFERMPAIRPPAFWFAKRQSLGARRDNASYAMPFESVLFIRLIPTDPKQKLISHDLAGRMASTYGSFEVMGNLYILRNEDGAAMCELAGNTQNVDSIAQYFNNGEIWGMNANIIRHGERGQFQYLIMPQVEEVFRKQLPRFIECMLKEGGVKLPIRIIGGVAGVKGRRLAWSGTSESGYSRMIKDNVEYERVLNGAEKPAIDEYLLGLFEAIFEASGKPRPDKFEGFPR
jgi:hypothetical protein